ncbi:MAG: thioredoxin domain-containing protein [Nanoarchaeota archaeon]|nr:thioredoxin [Nanoarchaeota archaeon]MBU1031057.1 thioredoxin [Nanoarchaeota archaeon]MBU1850089.1 thioredoxin [Nanoarchaeota archaeon]
MMLMTKRLIVLLLLLFVLVLTSCNNNDSLFTINSEGSFSQDVCIQKGLVEDVLMIESQYCSHCEATLPDFVEACAEKGVNSTILDVSVDEQRERMESYGVTISYTPTFIFGCDYYVGAKTKDEYLSMLDKYLEG